MGYRKELRLNKCLYWSFYLKINRIYLWTKSNSSVYLTLWKLLFLISCTYKMSTKIITLKYTQIYVNNSFHNGYTDMAFHQYICVFWCITKLILDENACHNNYTEMDYLQCEFSDV